MSVISKDKMIIDILLVRHGKTKMNEEKRYIGRTDEPLSELGKSEIMQKVENYKKLSGFSDAFFISSPMIRCLETAEMLTGMASYTLISAERLLIVDDFREIDFGDFEGKNYVELADNPDYIRWMESNGEMAFPGGEAKADYIERCVSAFTSLKDVFEAAYKKNRLIVMTVHGGTIMSLLSDERINTYKENAENLENNESIDKNEEERHDYYSYQIKNGEAYRISYDLSSGKIIMRGRC